MSEAVKWARTRKKWIRDNPPDHAGYWYCVVGGGALTIDQDLVGYGACWLTLDHDISRSRDPSKRHDRENINAMCGCHNRKKGSRSLKEFKDSKPHLRCRD